MARSARKKSKADDESTTYQILQYLARVAVWVYFRNVKVIARVPISKQGPLLVAANHMNMVLDPAVLIATFPHNRPCHFWALKRFCKIPLAGKILKAAGVLPVDTKTRSNAKLFEHTFDCLENGGVVALFPEGTSYTAPQHLPFKNGISWAAFEYLTHQFEKDNNSPCSIPIIPVGITYTTKNKWRSDVIVEYGEPINVTSKDLKDFQVDPKLAVKSLTNRIALGVEKGTINSPDWDTYYAAAEARYLLFGDKHNVRLEDYVHVSQSLIEIFHPSRIEDKTDPKWEERTYLKTRLLTFSKTLRQLHLTAKDISMYENREITMKRAIFRLASTWTALAIQLPLFLPGVIINWPIYLLGRLAERFEKYTESVAQDKLVLSVVVAIPLYGTIFYQLWKMMEFSLLGSVIALVTIPILAWYHMALVDKRYDMAKEVVASWRICIALTSSISGFNATPRRELEDAVQLQRWCRVNTKSLLLDLSKSGDIHARYLVQIGKSFIE